MDGILSVMMRNAGQGIGVPQNVGFSSVGSASEANSIIESDRNTDRPCQTCCEIFSFRLGTGLVFPHYFLEGRHRTPAVPVKAMRCNARMALIVWRHDWFISTSGIGLIPCH